MVDRRAGADGAPTPAQALTLEEYQRGARSTALYPTLGAPWVYPALGLANEAGEVLGKLKKVIRDQGGDISAETRDALQDELGDVLWYLAVLADELGISLGDIGQGNLTKLADRAARGVIQGDGDAR